MCENLNLIIDQDKKIPCNLYAEKMVLGSIILNQNLIPSILNKLKSEVFVKKEYNLLYSIITHLYIKYKCITLSSLISELEKEKLFNQIGGIETLYDLIDTIVDSDNFEEYVYLILDKYFRRKLIEAGNNISNLAYNDSTSLEIILEKAQSAILSLTNKKNINTIQTFSQLAQNLLIDIDNKSNDNILNGLTSGFKDFDSITQGFQKSDLIILASRPSMGKTALSLNIACNIAQNNNNSILIFSLEMTKSQLVCRILASNINLAMMKIKAGRLNNQEWLSVKSGIEFLSKFNIYIDDEIKLSPVKLRSKIISLLQQDKKLNLIIIDYLQLMQSDINESSRNQELSLITRSLKIIAREFDLPIIVLSQLSRNVESRNNKKPILADLRESGCIYKHSLIKSTSDKINKKINILLHTYSKLLIYSHAYNNNFVLTKIKNIYCTGKKILYQLITKTGYSIYLTANHKIKTFKGWKRLDSICLRDKIVICKRKILHDINIKNNQIYCSIYFDSIKSIFLFKQEQVYDIYMSKFKNFIANNILVHNSIEQDADLVCMIYRDEYYNPNTIEPNIAEISIVKQRNGPVGSFKLGFNSNSNKFFDL